MIYQIAEILDCTMNRTNFFTCSGDAPVGRGPVRKMLSVKEMKQVQEDKQKLTEHFIHSLPLLLDKYRADPEKLANLLTIPQYFDLDIYTKSRQEQNLDSLLKKIHTIVDKMHNNEVLETAAKTLEYMCVEGHAIFTRCVFDARPLYARPLLMFSSLLQMRHREVNPDRLGRQ